MKYFTIITANELNTIIPDAIKGYMNYEKDYTLGEAVQIKRELADGNWAISVQLKPLVSAKNPNEKLFDVGCVDGEIKPHELEMARQQYETIITESEFKQLEFKNKEELI